MPFLAPRPQEGYIIAFFSHLPVYPFKNHIIYLLLEFTEPVEFSRLEVTIDNMGLYTACSSAETRILIIPAIEGETFLANATLTIIYKLDMGNDKPRYYLKNNLTAKEQVDIELSV